MFALLSLVQSPGLSSLWIFCPGFIKCSYYTMFFLLLKVFCIRKGRYKSRNSLVHSYICRHRDVSVSLMFLGFKKALCFLYHYAA